MTPGKTRNVAERKATRRRTPERAPTTPEASPAFAGPLFEIGRSQILGKYWELANLDPEITKGNIAGQLKALDSLCEEMALHSRRERSEDGKKESVSGRPQQAIYRAAWLAAEK